MAQQTTVALIDDIDGSKGTETIQFGIDGHEFEIDLNSKNAKALRKALAEFTAAGRSVKRSAIASGRSAAPTRGRRKSVRPTSAVRGGSDETSAIRAWATSSGLTVAARGRISADIRARYAQATASGAS